MADTDARTPGKDMSDLPKRCDDLARKSWEDICPAYMRQTFADCKTHIDALRSRTACLTALLELALPHVEKAANYLATGPVAGPVEHLADDIRTALAKETDHG